VNTRPTIAELMAFTVAPRFAPIIEDTVQIKPLMHYCNDSASAEWLAAMREIETEGEITPAQTDPHPAVMDEQTPALLRKQAA
jgi:hypothetical protein